MTELVTTNILESLSDLVHLSTCPVVDGEHVISNEDLSDVFLDGSKSTSLMVR